MLPGRESSSLDTHDRMVFVVRTGRGSETWKQVCKHFVGVLMTVRQTCPACYSLFNQVKVIQAQCAKYGDIYSVRCCEHDFDDFGKRLSSVRIELLLGKAVWILSVMKAIHTH